MDTVKTQDGYPDTCPQYALRCEYPCSAGARVRLATKSGLVVLTSDELAALEAGTQYGLESEKESLFILEFFPLTFKHTFSGEQDDYFDNWV